MTHLVLISNIFCVQLHLYHQIIHVESSGLVACHVVSVPLEGPVLCEKPKQFQASTFNPYCDLMILVFYTCTIWPELQIMWLHETYRYSPLLIIVYFNCKHFVNCCYTNQSIWLTLTCLKTFTEYTQNYIEYYSSCRFIWTVWHIYHTHTYQRRLTPHPTLRLGQFGQILSESLSDKP